MGTSTPTLQYSITPLLHYSIVPSQYHQVIPVNHLHPLELPGFDLGGAKSGDAASEFGAVQIANPHHLTGRKITVAPGHAGWQEALPPFAQRLPGARIHEQRAVGMVKEGNPSLAATKPGRLRHEQSALFFARHHASHYLLLSARGDHERDPG